MDDAGLTRDEDTATFTQKSWEEFWERFNLFSILFFSILVDVLFLVGWAFATKGADFLFSSIIKPDRVGDVLRVIAEGMFDLSTISVIGAYLVRDLIRIVTRIWKQK